MPGAPASKSTAMELSSIAVEVSGLADPRCRGSAARPWVSRKFSTDAGEVKRTRSASAICPPVLAAAMIAPLASGYAIAGHLSKEPAAGAMLAHLGLRPLLDLDLRLGEGSGAALAFPLLQAAARIVQEMATFDSAGVSHKDDPGPGN